MKQSVLALFLSSTFMVASFTLTGCQSEPPAAPETTIELIEEAVDKRSESDETSLKQALNTPFPWPRSYEYLAQNAVLVFSGTRDWRHDSGIAGATAFWTRESDTQGFGIFTSENPEIFSMENLEKFSVIILNSTTGNKLLNSEQQSALERFVTNGGGLIIHHGGGDASLGLDWPWYADVIGTKFISHPMAPQLQEARVVTLAPGHPVMDGLSEGFLHTDEWYTFDGPVKGRVSVLAGLDESTYSPVNTVYGDVSDLRMGPEPSDHPIIWAKCLGEEPGKGRMVYSALGHTVATFDNEAHRTVLRNALAWVREETDAEGRFCP